MIIIDWPLSHSRTVFMANSHFRCIFINAQSSVVSDMLSCMLLNLNTCYSPQSTRNVFSYE
jgi:hypothetical protein